LRVEKKEEFAKKKGKKKSDSADPRVACHGKKGRGKAPEVKNVQKEKERKTTTRGRSKLSTGAFGSHKGKGEKVAFFARERGKLQNGTRGKRK